MRKFFLPFWIIGAIALFLYSYTQVDLSLTLNQTSVFQSIQKSFQYIGWFDRPLSAVLYIVVFAFLFGLYILSLNMISKAKVSRKTLWTAIFLVAGILTFSYNAFSYDLFNYIFDAKIITQYGLNPYEYKALDFPADPMLSFMHWTHRTYPYGPFWLILTVPISYLGGQIFIVTFFLFKMLIAGFFLLTCWAVEKIAISLKTKNSLIPLAVIGLNPYIISESLVSAHNDIVMMGLAMAGIYFVFRENGFRGWILIVFSVSTKFATLLPALLLLFQKIVKKKDLFIHASLMLMALAVIAASLRTNYQPWYFIFAFPLAAVLSNKKWILVPTVTFSIFNVIYYLPYLYTGNWNPPIPFFLNSVIITGLVLSILSGFIIFKQKRG